MTLTYDENIPGKVNSITDGVGRATVLAYNADGLLASITAPGCPVVSYTYDGGAENGWRLREVHYGDLEANQFTEYGYDTRDGVPTATLTMLRNFDGTQTNVVYDANLDTAAIGSYSEQMRRVVSLERTNGAVKGAKMKITYGHMHTIVTAVSDPENDETGKSLIYHFNSAGNVISTHDEMWYAVAAEYKSGIDNTPSATSNLIKTVINRVVSPDFASGWSQTKVCSTDTYARDTGTRCMNLPSAKIVKKGAGELRHKATVKLFESGEYTLSAYLKTTGLTVTSGYKGAFLRVTANGTVYESRPALSSTADRGVGTFASGWERLSVCFPFEYGEDTSVAIELVCDAKSGTLYWGCPQVESGRMANAFNLVTDGDFSLTTNNTAASTTRLFPKQWKVTGAGVSTSTLNCIVTDRAVNGMPDSVSGNAMRLTCKPSATDVYIAQDINARGAKGDVFTVSGWCNSLSVASGYSTFQPRIGVRFRTGSGNEYSGWQRFNFSTNRSGWNCISAQVAAPKDFYSIQIGVFYGRNANTGMFSHISLTRELYGNVYTYDAKGNVTAVKDLSNQKSAATYDSFDNLLSYVQPGSAATEKYLFTYGSTDAEKKRHLPLTSTTPTGVKTTTEYNAYGSAINATVQENASAPLIRTETEYTDDGNFVTKQREARGNEVTNTLDANGKLLSVTDPAGQSVHYSYDASNRVTGVQSTYTVNGESRTSRNEYTYENDRLKTVAHNTTGDAVDVVYNFEYDNLGRKTTVKVGEQALSTNVYSPDRKSRLEEVQYGNGGKVKYTYDDFDRVTGVGYDNDESPRFTYEYDSKGRAAFVKDATDGGTIRTGYDQTDRPNETEHRDGEGSLKYRTLIEYDKKNRVKAFNEATADQSFKTEYTYDADNRVTKVRYNGSDTSKVDYVYDKLNRITSRTVTNGTSAYATQYAYAPGATAYGENATTPLVSSITQGEGENTMNFAYTYDNRGNITSETRNGLTTTYVYDALGQLIRVNDPHENATWIYSYDRGGNIQNKAKHAYTTEEELGEAIESIPYTYGDANWKDKLTAYNGVSITYDAIGNPLNDGTWTYEWQAGRQLKRMTNASTGVTMEFTYNDSGLRTKKVKKVNDVLVETTEYLLNGKNVVGLTHTDHASNGVDTMHFFYDGEPHPVKVEFNGMMYVYVHNISGDSAGILDDSGTVVVEYKYNSWGGTVSTTGMLAATLGKYNPLRYRGYVYDEETELYYVSSRYYAPDVGRFINADDTDYLSEDDGSAGYNLFAYCMNDPVNRFDVDGNRSLPNWAKIVIGVVATAAAVVVTVATGGAAAPVLAGVAEGIVGTTALSVVIHRIATGSWEGTGQAVLDGIANGFMFSGLSAFGYSVAKGVVEMVKNARAGITIGKQGTFESVSELAKTRRYEGLKEFNFIKKNFGVKAAETVGWWQNKCIVKGVMLLRGPIYDCGGELTGAYAKEVLLTKGYKYLYNIWLM